ncbi:phosphatidylinositol-specific phospholipase C [Streptomyces sp. NPDC000594]|uniref:phosphatidylinositol-specific phospholipase C n=1 Tax=Streptomyces sp. NPDC000594 TaxID=3154261 RepID=UPI003320494B
MERRSLLTAAAALTATAALTPPSAALAAPRRPRTRTHRSGERRPLATADWLAAHPDTTPLQRLTIPGTHDSGARFGGPWAECQNTTVAEQLNSGVRFLDIRCRITGDSFAIHHGAAFQNMMFGDVLIACRDFLAAHPSETVLMRVKQEYSQESDAAFRRIFDLYLDQKGWRPLFRIADGLPVLGAARGRVVLLADNGGLPGVRWGDGTLFDIQDDWNAAPAAKYPKIEAHFRKATAQPGRLFVNHVSTAAYLPPRWNSDNLNPRVHTFLDGAANGWRGLGIVPLDFVGTRQGLVESLIRHN